MTAIISYINSTHVALAVDSAITILNNGTSRIEYGYKKLFQIKGKKIALIQYNNPWFCNVEINEIINDFNEYSNTRIFLTVEICFQSFINFIEENNDSKFLNVHNGLAMGLIFVGFGDLQKFVSFYRLDFISFENGKVLFEVNEFYDMKDNNDLFTITGDSIHFALDFIEGKTVIKQSLKDEILCFVGDSKGLDILIDSEGRLLRNKIKELDNDKQAIFCAFLIQLISKNQQNYYLNRTVGGPIGIATIEIENGFLEINNPNNKLEN